MAVNTKIDQKYNPSLARIFSNSVISELVKDYRSKYIPEILTLSGFCTLSNERWKVKELFDSVYSYLAKSYRNEYVYKNAINESIGIMELTPRNTIKTVREASSRKHLVEQGVIFDSLRKVEYIQIINEKFGFVPDVPNTQIHSECKSLFLKLSPEEAHDSMVEALKSRGNSGALKNFINSIPYSLKAFALNSRLNKKEKSRFLDLLDEPCGWLLNPATH